MTRQTALRTLAVDQATAEAVAALRAAGVECLVFKGPAYAAVFGERALRPYRDADLLVQSADVERAETILASLGYVGPSRGAFDGRRAPAGIEHYRVADRAIIDLHVTVHGATVEPERVWAALSDQADMRRLYDVDIPVPGPAGVAYIVAAHAAHHGSAAKKPLGDLEVALAAIDEATWQQAAALAEKLGALAFLQEGLRLVPDGAELAARLRPDTPRSTDAVLAAQGPPPSALGWQRILAAEGTVARARLLGREIAPSPEYMRTWSKTARARPRRPRRSRTAIARGGCLSRFPPRCGRSGPRGGPRGAPDVCGIAGIAGGDPRDFAPALRAMTDSMRHRGPDDRGESAPSEHGGVCACRLAIQDPSGAGHQPMRSERSGRWVAFNGEIYNVNELRDRARGPRPPRSAGTPTPRSCSPRYDEWGDDFLGPPARHVRPGDLRSRARPAPRSRATGWASSRST